MPAQLLGDKVGDFVPVFGKEHAGLTRSYDHQYSDKPASIYVREDVLTIWKALSMESVYVTLAGPPGVGKSTAVWAWARATAHTKQIYWLHCATTIVRGVRLSNNLVEYKDVYSTQEFIESCGDGILIVDGITKAKDDILLPVRRWQDANQKGRAVILVTSEPVT